MPAEARRGEVVLVMPKSHARPGLHTRPSQMGRTPSALQEE